MPRLPLPLCLPMLVWVSSAQAANLPNLPQKQVDITMPVITGNTYTATCADLQSKLDAAAAADPNLNHEVILATGTPCTRNGSVGPPYKLPAHNSGTGWIVIKGANFASLPPPGTRVTAADAAQMPVIQYAEDGVSRDGAFTAETNAQRYRIVGIKYISNPAYQPNYGLIWSGHIEAGYPGTNTGYIIVDRNFYDDSANTTQRSQVFFYMNAELGNTAIVDSYIAGIKDVGNQSDTQCILLTNNPGPSLIQNNRLRCSGENIMTGGGGTPNRAAIPADITIRRNEFDKDPAWAVIPSNNLTKTLFELKTALRVLVEGNDFHDMGWNDGGRAFRLTPRAGNGGEWWDEVSDLTYRYNRIYNCFNWVNAIASDDQASDPGNPWYHTMGGGTYRMKRIHFHDNLVYAFPSNDATCGPYGCGTAFSVQNGGTDNWCTDPVPGAPPGISACQMEDFIFEHNTIDGPVGRVMSFNRALSYRLDFRDNLINSVHSYGLVSFENSFNTNIYGTQMLNWAFGNGPAALTWLFSNNGIAALDGNSAASSAYPQGAGNQYLADASAFLWRQPMPVQGTGNPLLADYTLQAGSPAIGAASDGTDMGVNFAAYNAARAGNGPPPDIMSPKAPSSLTVQ